MDSSRVFMRNSRYVLILLVLVVVMTGCRAPQEAEVDYAKPLAPGELALRKLVNPADIPDFTIASYELDNFREAITNSLNYMAKPSSQKFFPYGMITHDRAVASLCAVHQALREGVGAKAVGPIQRGARALTSRVQTG
jgi:membrane-bound lytic murein transglycosylase A